MTYLLTVDEYRASSTGQDTNNLVAGVQALQDAELLRKIAAATSWITTRAGQELIASSRVELIRCRYQRDGTLSVHPRNGHLNQLVAVSVGTNASDLAVVSTTGAFIEDDNWIIPGISGVWTSAGPIQFGPNAGGRVLCKLSHIAGWPNTVLTNAPIATATLITVADGSGFSPAIGSEISDEPIRIIDADKTETITITAVNGTALTVAPLAYAHSIGAVVSGMPANIKEAALMATSAHLRSRSSDAMVMAQASQANSQPNRDGQRWQLLADAGRIIDNYARVR